MNYCDICNKKIAKIRIQVYGRDKRIILHSCKSCATVFADPLCSCKNCSNSNKKTLEQQQVVERSPEPEIKCYVGDNKLCDALSYSNAKSTLEKIGNLTDVDWLWTEESAYCICTHHVVYHCTIRDKPGFVVSIHCHGDNELCSCEHFRAAQKLRKENEDEAI